MDSDLALSTLLPAFPRNSNSDQAPADGPDRSDQLQENHKDVLNILFVLDTLVFADAFPF